MLLLIVPDRNVSMNAQTMLFVALNKITKFLSMAMKLLVHV